MLAMPKGVYLGFDFGYKRIGVAVGQRLTCSASPLSTIEAKAGIPDWNAIQKVITQWNPQALIVGLPTCIDDSELYTTSAARRFAKQLHKRFTLPVHLVDERLSTVEARGYLFEQGGYRRIKKAEVDSIAACVILEQWLQQSE
ncbi:TPA: Holliday junction resolvase RuvX [Legionella pneumophila]|uniref:Putative pre-16S rRNA nuclease n=2 Tax=Legionella pneumophila TaxID=446 RepID=A0AAX2IX97_LEGPN|nr:Holliday junction resolvase RuvX [Legionella pneumophila subsp. pascullei]HAT6918229.1 Holliday junction resolvase RuvX [Legionella pneumophila]SQG89419.1 putative ribonuclease [Legionella pneumophila subsp. pascullei]VEH04673.1 putative ribonuclease [Legionella pneumophila subsp. pascullei]HAT6921283.1 Holliday junction resolvase RuvX [Legionella pneumophila]